MLCPSVKFDLVQVALQVKEIVNEEILPFYHMRITTGTASDR
jgi:hypothetical protein